LGQADWLGGRLLGWLTWLGAAVAVCLRFQFAPLWECDREYLATSPTRADLIKDGR